MFPVSRQLAWVGKENAPSNSLQIDIGDRSERKWSTGFQGNTYAKREAYINQVSSCSHASSFSRKTYLASLVLGDLVGGMPTAVLALAESVPRLGNVDLFPPKFSSVKTHRLSQFPGSPSECPTPRVVHIAIR